MHPPPSGIPVLWWTGKHACWFSSSARAVTAVAPRMVPRMVCGRRNFQNAVLNAVNLSTADPVSASGRLSPASCIARHILTVGLPHWLLFKI